MRTNKNNGPYFVFAAAVLWSFAGICSKFIPWGPISIACLRGVIAAITIGCFTGQWFFKPSRAVLLAGIATAATSILFMIANKMTTAANAIVLQYTAPAFVIILTALFNKTRPRLLDIITVLLTLCGISLSVIEHLGNGAILGDLISVVSGVTFSLVFFANRLPGANAMQASYLGCLLHGVFLPFLFFDKGLRSFDPSAWLVILAAGVIQLGLAYILFSKGIKTTSAVSSSIIAMVEPILNPVWVFLFMGERPGTMAIVGAGIVIVTIVAYNVISVRQQNRSVSEANKPDRHLYDKKATKSAS